ncbi:MAG: glycoside hydrolase family 18 protein [Candidatus Babeliales bacterium]
MVKRSVLALLFSCLATLRVSAAVFVGYYPEWAHYRVPSTNPFIKKVDPSDIAAQYLTHINYAFAKPKEDGSGAVTLFDQWAATGYVYGVAAAANPYSGNLGQLLDLKKKYPHIKTLLSIGGWTLSNPFPILAASSKTRSKFVGDAIRLAKAYSFDGIDIDWEFPGFAEHGGTAQDKANFTLLLQELYSKAHAKGLLVTIAAPATIDRLSDIELDKIHKYVDWINIMAYDYNGPWSPNTGITNHNAPLYKTAQGNPDYNIDATVAYYLRFVPSEKVVLGLPLYGRAFGGVKGTGDSLFAQYTSVGKGTVEPGVRSFGDIKTNLLNPSEGYAYYWDSTAKVPYLFNKVSGDFISYDNEESLQLKVRYLKDKKLGGGMVWDLSQDSEKWDGLQTINNELKAQ